MNKPQVKPLSAEARIEAIKFMTEDLVRTCAEAGFTITVTQVPKQPFAMGYHDTVVEVRDRSYRSK
jgi:hypothetical protein